MSLVKNKQGPEKTIALLPKHHDIAAAQNLRVKCLWEKQKSQPGFQTAVSKIEPRLLTFIKKKNQENNFEWKVFKLKTFFYLSTDSIKCGCDCISKWTIKCYMYKMDQNGIYTDST